MKYDGNFQKFFVNSEIRKCFFEFQNSQKMLLFIDITIKGTCLACPAPTVRLRGMETGISEASKRVSIFSFATQGGKQVSFHFRQRNWVQAREAQIRFSAG